MTYVLGQETIRAVSDGGVAISYINDEEKLVSWEGKFPVLSVEAIPLTGNS